MTVPATDHIGITHPLQRLTANEIRHSRALMEKAIQLEVKATGVVFATSYVEDSRYASELAPGLGAPYHQHLFNARLDMMVDGLVNAVGELDIQRIPVGPDNPYGNAFTRRATRLTRESEAARLADPAIGRAWKITNPTSTNRLGQPVGYLLPSGTRPAS
jgi:primary-amine oxidase